MVILKIDWFHGYILVQLDGELSYVPVEHWSHLVPAYPGLHEQAPVSSEQELPELPYSLHSHTNLHKEENYEKSEHN